MNGLLLRLFPRAWRERYGEELDELLVRTSTGRRPGLRATLDVARAGLGERLRASGLTGDGRPAHERALAHALLVLSSWSLFVLAGCAVQKASEHWQAGLPGDRALPEHAFAVLEIAAVAGGALVLTGVALALPAFLRSGRRSELVRPLARALAANALFAIAGACLVLWAHRLSPAGRNGDNLAYALAALGTAGLAAVSLVAWTIAAVAAARRSELSLRVLRCEVVIAALVAASMAVMLASSVTWWYAASPAIGSQLAVPVLAMLVSVITGSVGAIGALRALGPAAGSSIG